MPGAPAAFTGPQTRCFCQEESRRLAQVAVPPAINPSKKLNPVPGLPQPFATRLCASLSSPPFSTQSRFPNLLFLSVLWGVPPDPTSSPRTLRPPQVPIHQAQQPPQDQVSPMRSSANVPLDGFSRALRLVGAGGAPPSLTHLCERSLDIQLPPKQVQLLLLELLLTAHHVYNHAAVCISLCGRSLQDRRTVTGRTRDTACQRPTGWASVTHQACRAVPRPVADGFLQLRQHGEQILSHCREHRGAELARSTGSPPFLPSCEAPAPTQTLVQVGVIASCVSPFLHHLLQAHCAQDARGQGSPVPGRAKLCKREAPQGFGVGSLGGSGPVHAQLLQEGRHVRVPHGGH